MLTTVFFLIFDKFVNFKVCGISQISKPFLVILEIVKETPLIKIDAFSIKIFLYFLFTENSKILCFFF